MSTGIAAGLLILYSVVTLAAGDLNMTALRDAAPYMYAVLVFFGQTYRAIPARTAQILIFTALLLHAAWYSVAEFVPSAISTPTPGDDSVLLFGGRADIDGAFLGVLLALSLDRVMLGRTAAISAAVGSWAFTLVLLTQSRASLLATLAAVGFVLLRHLILWQRNRRREDGALDSGDRSHQVETRDRARRSAPS